MFRLHTHSNKDKNRGIDSQMMGVFENVLSYIFVSQEWKCKKLQIVYVIVAAMDKDIVATATKDVHLVPDEIMLMSMQYKKLKMPVCIAT